MDRLPNIEDFVEGKMLDELFEQYLEEAKTGQDPPEIDDIVKAIENREYVGIYYAGPKGEVKDGFRLIEPYTLGRGYFPSDGFSKTPSSRKYLRAYVVRDSKQDPSTSDKKNFTRRKSVSKSQRRPYWRLFRVDRIKNWENLGRKITKWRELYDPNDDMMQEIIADVDKEDFSKGMQRLTLPKALRNKVGS